MSDSEKKIDMVLVLTLQLFSGWTRGRAVSYCGTRMGWPPSGSATRNCIRWRHRCDNGQWMVDGWMMDNGVRKLTRDWKRWIHRWEIKVFQHKTLSFPFELVDASNVCCNCANARCGGRCATTLVGWKRTRLWGRCQRRQIGIECSVFYANEGLLLQDESIVIVIVIV